MTARMVCLFLLALLALAPWAEATRAAAPTATDEDALVVRQEAYPIALRYRQQLLCTICQLHAASAPAQSPEAAVPHRPEATSECPSAATPLLPGLLHVQMSMQT